MSIEPQKHTQKPSVLEFKSSSFSVPVLMLTSNDLGLIGQQLLEKISVAPKFFEHSPIIVDLQELNRAGLAIDLAALAQTIRGHSLFPVGIRSANALQQQEAAKLMLPVYPAPSAAAANETPKPKQAPTPAPSCKLITQPIRSGQRVYATGDLIVLATVSPGAEIMSEANIHVYGTLRGRALAGVQGDTSARIFCTDLQAELLSIAGNYKLTEDLKGMQPKKPVQVFLQEHTLVIQAI